MKLLFLFIGFVFTSFCFSQNETTKWYFGHKAALDFMSGTPVFINGSTTNHIEGSASIADAAGNLLFYTDGDTVWNKNNIPMPNGTGLLGGISSTQIALIVKQPGNTNIYYVFTTDYFGQANGLNYSIVDMSLNGGVGDVTIKNVLMYTPTSEKITTIKHCNGTDIWIITHEALGNTFHCFLLTAAGIDLSSIQSSVGTLYQTTDLIGQMKASPNGLKLAAALNNSFVYELYDFDKSTGIVSNPITLTTTMNSAYSVEFSPDNTKLYGANRVTKEIVQWDLCGGIAAAIINSAKVVGVSPIGNFGSFQLAPNGKIYIAINSSAILEAINNPNLIGVACNYVNNAVDLSPAQSSAGLPNFASYYFNISGSLPLASISFINTSGCICNGSATAKILNDCGTGPYSYSWSTGTTIASTYTDTSLVLNLCAGSYNIIIKDASCKKDTLYFTVGGSVATAINVAQNAAICFGKNYTLPKGGITNIPGIYHDTLVSFTGCDSIITTTLIVDTIRANLAVTICKGNGYTLPNGTTVNTPGTYSNTLTTANGCDSIITTTLIVDTIRTNQAATICKGSGYTLPNGTAVNTPGTYSNTLTTTNGCDSIITTTLIVDTIRANQAATICKGNGYTLPNGTIVNTAGAYSNILTTANGCDSIIITTLIVDTIRTNQAVTICKGSAFTLPDATTVNTSGVYASTLATANGCDSIITTNLIVNTIPTAGVSPDATLLPGLSTTLIAAGGGVYNWWPSSGLNTVNGNTVIAKPAATTLYCVSVTTNGCSDTICVKVTLENPCPTTENLAVPSAFSPNADGKNDDFCLQGWDACIEEFLINIYDRFGERAYTSTQTNFCWDGKYHGTVMDTQVFVYYIHAKYMNVDKAVTKKGNISLIR